MPHREEIERLRSLKVEPSQRLRMRVEVPTAGDPLLIKARIGLTSSSKEDGIDRAAFHVTVVEAGTERVLIDRGPLVIGPAPGEAATADVPLKPSAELELELGYLNPGTYWLSFEYFSEIGVRASVLRQKLVIPETERPARSRTFQ